MRWIVSTLPREISRARGTGVFSTCSAEGFGFPRSSRAGCRPHRSTSTRRSALSRLADELNDVQGFSGIGPDVGDFLLAADWLFDNVFMDAMVQQRIAESRERVAQAIAQCEDVRDQLLALRRPNRGAGNGLPGAE